MSDPYLDAPDPSQDPRGFLVRLLSRFLPPGVAESTIRTWVPVAVGAAIAWAAANWNIVIPEDASSTLVVLATGAAIAGYYTLVRLVERRWPRVGRLLLALGLVKGRPVYAAPDEAVRVLLPGGGIRTE